MKGKRLVFPDILRIIAAVGVIIIHVTAIIISQHKVGSLEWNIANIFNSLFRWSVPVFFMISGMMFLNLKKEIGIQEFIKKYVVRIIICIVVWGYLYGILDTIVYNGQINIISFVIAFLNMLSGKAGYHLWFLYTLLIIYLFVPILKRMVENTERNILKYVLFVWEILGVGLNTINGILNCLPQNIFGEVACALPELIVYIGYFVLGYYLNTYSISKKQEKILNVAFMLSIVAMPLGNYVISMLNGSYQNPFSGTMSIFTMIICVRIFLFVKNREYKNNESKKKDILFYIGQCTFGVYLIHVAVLTAFKPCILRIGGSMSLFLLIPLYTIFVFGISLLITMIIKKIPGLKKFV